MSKSIFVLIFCLLASYSRAEQVGYYEGVPYVEGSEINHLNLEGNFTLIRNIINGGLDNTNTADNFEFVEIVSSLPTAGEEGRTVYLTTDDLLYFDDGATWHAVATYTGTPVAGDILYFDGTNWARLAKGTNEKFLQIGANIPSWQKVDLADTGDITGTLALGNGGTGVTTLAALGGIVPRFATKVVAANDSIVKTGADYVCDGTADDVQINAAIAAASGGRVVLLEGTYNIAATIDLDVIGIVLEGQGWKTILKAVQNLNDEVINCTVDEAQLKNQYVENSSNTQSTLETCVYFVGADNTLIENVKISGRMDIADYPLEINDCDRIKIVNNYIICSTGGRANEGIVHMVGDCLYVFFKGNSIDGTAVSVANTRLMEIHAALYSNIINNTLVGDNDDVASGIYLSADSDYNNIIGNIIYNINGNGIIIPANANENIVDGNQTSDGLSDAGTGTVIGDNNTGD